jgi:AcrR family transcriptional regulator
MGVEATNPGSDQGALSAEKPWPRQDPHHLSRMVQLIEAAEHVFLKQGFHTATMSDVAKAAGMSKKTVYQLIPSKAELFAALLAHQEAKMPFPVLTPDRNLREVLVEHLRICSATLLSPKQIAIIRLIMAEFTHSPELGRLFHQKYVLKTKSKMEGLFIDLALEAGVSDADAREFAAMLFGMALGEFILGALVGFKLVPTKAALDRRINHAVDVFLAGCKGANLPLKTKHTRLAAKASSRTDAGCPVAADQRQPFGDGDEFPAGG